MRWYKKSHVILSEDNASEPKNQKFAEEDNIVDLTSLVNESSSSKTYAIGAHSIPLTGIAQVRYVYIKADEDITVEINGAAALTLLADKPTELWAVVTSLTINTAASTRIVLAVAGS